METDIAEDNNLYAQHPEIVEELTSILQKYVANGRSTEGEKMENDVEIDIFKKGPIVRKK